MIIGKTSQSLSKQEILEKYGEVRILTTVFPQVTTIPCVICSPLRNDTRPSFSISLSNGGHIYYKDFAHTEIQGSLLDLLCAYWNCSFSQALNKICNLFLNSREINIKQPIKVLTKEQAANLTDIQVVVRPWKNYDFKYWESYGITEFWLHYAEIYPISQKIVIKKESNARYVFPADKYAYCFVERKEGKTQLKIYQPYNKVGYKWCSKMDGSVVGLWTKIPEYGEKVVICSSLKDALCLSCQLHIPTLCLQGEGYGISDTAINELKRRYKKIFICFDTDAPGIIDSKKLAEKTGFINVIPNLGNEKDISDYYKSLKDKKEFKLLEKYFT